MSTATNYKNNITRVRQMLTDSDGMTLREIMEETGMTYSSAYKALWRLDGVHVDRWTIDDRPSVCKWERVFRLETPRPPDAPMPEVSVREYMASYRG